MNTRKNAAIILLGMGEHCAAEILKSMNQKDVESIIEIMNNIQDVTEEEVVTALNDFFNETKKTTGLTLASHEYIRNSLVSAVGSEKADNITEPNNVVTELKGFELLKWQPLHTLMHVLKDEHPQIITIALMCLEGEKAAELLKWLPNDLSQEIVIRMTKCNPVSQFAISKLAEYFEEEFTKQEKFRVLASDGMNKAANIISYMDPEMEVAILDRFSQTNKDASEKLKDKLFPFEKLTQLDSRSLQKLLSEVENDVLLLSLKSCDEETKAIFYKNMSQKSANILKEDLASMGPVKLNDMMDAQKQMIEIAKKLNTEGKIFIPTARQGTMS